MRLAGFFTVDRRRLEADEGGKAEENADRRRAGQNGRGRKRDRRQPAVAALGEDRDIDDQHHEIFKDDQNRQHLGGEVDAAIAENADGGDAHERPDPPG
ncbi:hypothetical protein D9M72_517850 [compost metagenome]